MFRAEVENSLDDAKDLAAAYAKRFKQDEITNYVFNENEAFLAQEIHGISELITEIADYGASRFGDEKEAAETVRGLVRERVSAYGDPEAVYRIVDRKIEKILKYIAMSVED
jgi:hypothetical protein